MRDALVCGCDGEGAMVRVITTVLAIFLPLGVTDAWQRLKDVLCAMQSSR